MILFLCPHAAAKSVIAAAYCRREAGRLGLSLRVDAAGMDPDSVTSPAVVAALRDEGIDVSDHRPRRASHAELASPWRIVSLGCDLADVPSVSSPIECWDNVPPASVDLNVCMRSIAEHVALMLRGVLTPK